MGSGRKGGSLHVIPRCKQATASQRLSVYARVDCRAYLHARYDVQFTEPSLRCCMLAPRAWLGASNGLRRVRRGIEAKHQPALTKAQRSGPGLGLALADLRLSHKSRRFDLPVVAHALGRCGLAQPITTVTASTSCCAPESLGLALEVRSRTGTCTLWIQNPPGNSPLTITLGGEL